MNHGETQQQLALMQWAGYVRVGAWWLRELLIHVPNGGRRTPTEGAILQGMGVKKGWPDLQLLVPVRDYHGALWELKDTDGRLSPDQLHCHQLLRAFGYYVATFDNWALCSQDILRYLALPGAPQSVFSLGGLPASALSVDKQTPWLKFKPGPRMTTSRRFNKGHKLRIK